MADAFPPPERGAARDHRLPPVLRAPFEARTWREFGYLLLNLPMGIVGFVWTVTMLSLGAGLLVTFIGLPVLALALGGCRAIGVVERARARSLLWLEVEEPGPVRPKSKSRGGLLAKLGAQLGSGVNWRHVIYALVHFPWGIFTFTVSISLFTYGWGLLTYPLWRWVFPVYFGQDGLQVYGSSDGHHGWWLHTPADMLLCVVAGGALVLTGPWLTRGMAHVDRILVLGLLGPSKLADRVSELESDRGVVVDTAAADLRRIERDLHDGAQQRLVSLAVNLGLARATLGDLPEDARKVIDEAHREAKEAIAELNNLVRGLHPAVLEDRGLDAALSGVAARLPIPVRVAVDLRQRPSPTVEAVAYFVVSEALTNVVKHAQATRADVTVERIGETLLVVVADDGAGGADLAVAGGGTGLAGLAKRVASVDGTFSCRSPAGGPTVITVELPCVP